MMMLIVMDVCMYVCMLYVGDDLRLDLTVPFKTSIFGGEEKVGR